MAGQKEETNMAAKQEEEVTNIKEEFKGRCRTVELRDCRNVTLQPPHMDLTIKFHLTKDYPAVAPKISIRTQCMEEEDVLDLQQLLQLNSNKYLNQPMMARLSSDAETWLKQNGLGKSMKTGKAPKHKKRHKKPLEDKPIGEKLASMKTADDVVKRIQWDSNLPQEDFLVGYLDRFLGIKEKYFTAFSWEDIASVDYNVLAIPKHRIQYFKFKDLKIWDKLTRLDHVFDSLGGGKKITDIIDNYEAELATFRAEHPQEESDNTSHVGENPSSDNTSHVEDVTSSDVTASKRGTDIKHNSSESDSDSDSDDGIVVTIGTSCNTDNPLTSHPGYWQDKLRPNYFLAVRVTNPGVKTATQEIQDYIVSKQPLYTQCCVPSSSLHITLRTLGLDTQEQIDNCSRVLHNIRDELATMVPKEPLVLNGVSNFYSRVVYAKIESSTGFLDLVDHICMCLRHEGIEIRDQHAFVPHMTIMKTSRPVSRRMGTANIDKSLYSGFSEKFLGEVKISGIYLCSMGEDRQDDGFYISPANIQFEE